MKWWRLFPEVSERHGTWGYGLVTRLAVQDQWFDSLVLEVFSKLKYYDFMILLFHLLEIVLVDLTEMIPTLLLLLCCLCIFAKFIEKVILVGGGKEMEREILIWRVSPTFALPDFHLSCSQNGLQQMVCTIKNLVQSLFLDSNVISFDQMKKVETIMSKLHDIWHLLCRTDIYMIYAYIYNINTF